MLMGLLFRLLVKKILSQATPKTFAFFATLAFFA